MVSEIGKLCMKRADGVRELAIAMSRHPNWRRGSRRMQAGPIAPPTVALQLQRLLPDGSFKIVAVGEKKDEAPAIA
jgi:hypothetical protein